MNNSLRLTVITLLLAGSNLSAATLYVSAASLNPTPPYTNWATAATNLQDAVDRSHASDTVLVADGVYNAGFQFTDQGFSEVAVSNAVALRSVNGAPSTVIDGGGNNRCVYTARGLVCYLRFGEQ